MILSVIPLALSCVQCVMVVGHRGNGCSHPSCLNQYPENSIPSYLEAFRVGAEVVELDVWISADNQIVVSHRSDPGPNDSLNASIVVETVGQRTPLTGQYKHSDRHKYKIKAPWSLEKPDSKFYLSDAYNTPYDPTLYIPLLSSVFKEICPTGKKIIVELKGDNATLGPRVLDLIFSMNVQSCIHAISSFYWQKYQNPSFKVPADLFEPIKQENRIKKALLINRKPANWNHPFIAAEYYGATFFHPACSFAMDADFRGNITDKAHKAGMGLSCYFGSGNVDTEQVLKQYLKSGMDEICTNNPGLLRRLVDEQNYERAQKSSFSSI